MGVKGSDMSMQRWIEDPVLRFNGIVLVVGLAQLADWYKPSWHVSWIALSLVAGGLNILLYEAKRNASPTSRDHWTYTRNTPMSSAPYEDSSDWPPPRARDEGA
jgi:hypothetical protein